MHFVAAALILDPPRDYLLCPWGNTVRLGSFQRNASRVFKVKQDKQTGIPIFGSIKKVKKSTSTYLSFSEVLESASHDALVCTTGIRVQVVRMSMFLPSSGFYE